MQKNLRDREISFAFPLVALAVITLLVTPIVFLLRNKSPEPIESLPKESAAPNMINSAASALPTPQSAPVAASPARVAPPASTMERDPGDARLPRDEAHLRPPEHDYDTEQAEKNADPALVARRNDEEQRLRDIRESTTLQRGSR